MAVRYQYHSLEDFLATNELSVDAQIDDGWGALFPVKGREVEATVLFSDISGFSGRTLDLSPTETLIFVNNFFTWVSTEALQGHCGIVDKYIGDEIMVVFSKEFGSDDPFVDAVQTARWMSEHDAFGFRPHVGIASGPVTVGYVGNPIKYNCSVFGAAVAVAARCAAVQLTRATERPTSAAIVFPSSEWGRRSFEEVFSPVRYRHADGTIHELSHAWEMHSPRRVPMKNLPDTMIIEIVKRSVSVPQQSAEDRAREALAEINKAGRYWPSHGRE
jgi:class 3 adenylate cyclase